MKKIMNEAENFVDETIEGIIYAYSDKLKLLNGDKRIIITNFPVEKGKVRIVTDGGSGHLPLFLGYIEDGMLDECAVGNVFASPSANKMTEMIKACDYGAGVLCLYGNYGGDNMNFDMACENADFEDIKRATIRVKNDIASNEDIGKRRGVAGMVYAFKIAGASAKKMMTANEIASAIFEKITTEISLNENDEVSVMVNGLGGTPLEEQLIVYRQLHILLKEKKVNSYMPYIGEFATSMEMAGLSISILKLKELLRYPAMTPFYTNHNK